MFSTTENVGLEVHLCVLDTVRLKSNILNFPRFENKKCYIGNSTIPDSLMSPNGIPFILNLTKKRENVYVYTRDSYMKIRYLQC